MDFIKPPISFTEQVERLNERGLLIENPEFAKKQLQRISFYRLRAYTFPFKDNTDPSHPFVQNVSFQDILSLQEFDKQHRLVVFEALEKLEIAIRTQVIYYLSMEFDGWWYEDVDLFHKKVAS
jgi:abortive infection bacteriophage resistance protein